MIKIIPRIRRPIVIGAVVAAALVTSPFAIAAAGDVSAQTEVAVQNTAVMWAVIDSNGTLVRGSGASNANRSNVGDYRVTFARDLQGCAIQATITRPASIGSVPAPGTAVTGNQFVGTSRAFIRTFDSAGTQADRPVAVTVTC